MTSDLKTWPTLEHQGKYWKVWTKGSIIYTEHGKIGGKPISSEVQVKRCGNQVTLEAQAQFRAEKKWRDQQRKKNYTIQGGGKSKLTKKERTEQAQMLKLQEVPLPMLAKTADFRTGKKKDPQGDRVHQMPFPCLAQPKIDGFRCFSDRGQHLYTRTRKLFIGLPSLKRHLQEVCQALPKKGFGSGRFYLDGELFVEGVPFQDFTKIVKPAEHHADHDPDVQYRLFDCFDLDHMQTPFHERYALLRSLFQGKRVFPLEVRELKSRKDVDDYCGLCIDRGDEGIMLRNPDSPYQCNKRSFDLQKVKLFEDAEFVIVGYKDGQGRDEGAVIWRCQTHDGLHTFDVKNSGPIKARKEMFKRAQEYMGRKLTVKFQGYSNDMVPRFPVGRFRPDFDMPQ